MKTSFLPTRRVPFEMLCKSKHQKTDFAETTRVPFTRKPRRVNRRTTEKKKSNVNVESSSGTEQKFVSPARLRSLNGINPRDGSYLRTTKGDFVVIGKHSCVHDARAGAQVYPTRSRASSAFRFPIYVWRTRLAESEQRTTNNEPRSGSRNGFKVCRDKRGI